MLKYVLARGATLAAAAAVASAACAPPNSPIPDVFCEAGASLPADWRLVDLGPFSMRVPPGFEEADVSAIDSRAGMFRDARTGSRISYDYGWYSDDLAPDPGRLTERVRCREDIGGRPATVVIGELVPPAEQEGRFVAAAAWRNLRADGQPVHLTIWSTAPDSTELSRLRAALRSVEFR
jgi:hypothetical protein